MICTFDEEAFTELKLVQALRSRGGLDCYGPRVIIVFNKAAEVIISDVPEVLVQILDDNCVGAITAEGIDQAYALCAGHWLDITTMLGLIGMESEVFVYEELSGTIFSSICKFLKLDYKELLNYITWGKVQ